MGGESGYRIMIVEDDQKIAKILAQELERYGMVALIVEDFTRVKEAFCSSQPDLVLLDINLPKFDGYYWCRQIRTLSKVPIIFVSARDQDVDQVRALESGGDDYISKPFNLELAIAKINSLLRRTYGEYAVSKPLDVLAIGDVVINRADSSASRGDVRVELTAKELELLWILAQRNGTIVSREELLDVLWDDEEFVDDNTLTVNVSRLRRRLDELGLGQAIETRRGQGYRLSL
ncbi:MAG: response regulator transcription factor [Bacillota bacterium]|jgi:DNA-binding response OmpR family regulator|nr:response regulator transcription factor [Bacillota bacterium]HQD17546.1 response regulator transcription factor [Bacillota bacterium]